MMVAEVVSVPLIFLSLHRQTSVVVCANFFSVWPASVIALHLLVSWPANYD